MSTDVFSAWFNRQLKRRQWGPADFHRESGVSRSTVYSWVNGTRVPDPPLCQEIADAFGMALDTVLVVAGHRVDDDELPPDDPRRQLCELILALPPDKLDPLFGLAEYLLKREQVRISHAPPENHRTPSGRR